MARKKRLSAQVHVLVPQATKDYLRDESDSRGVSEGRVLRELIRDGLAASGVSEDVHDLTADTL